MNYKLIEDKNGTIISKGKRYRMSKLEYTKDDLIDMQNDYDLLYKKLDNYNKIINTQALEIARLKESKDKLRSYIVEELKAYERGFENYKRYGVEDYTKGLAVGFKKCLEILGDDKEND